MKQSEAEIQSNRRSFLKKGRLGRRGSCDWRWLNEK